jgi:hypothetical protein
MRDYHVTIISDEQMARLFEGASDWRKRRAEAFVELRKDTVFPHRILVETWSDSHDHDLRDWLWPRLGPAHGECDRERCPDADFDPEADGYVIEFTRQDGSQYRRMIDPEEWWVLDHSHVGCWRTDWLMKTGYDFGIAAYGFARAEDAEMFRQHVTSMSGFKP